MFNYIKSELYRVSHTRPAYTTTALLCGSILFINIALFLWGNGAEWYGHTSFSYALNISEPFLYVYMGALVAFVLYVSPQKNGDLKNSVAFGLSRTEIFLSQCLVALVTATVIMCAVLACWIPSAELLLARTDIWTLSDFLSSSFYVYLLAAAGLISAVFFISIFSRELTGLCLWLVVWNIVPMALKYLGLKFEICATIASWMPDNFFATQSIVRWWEDPDIFEKALISGIVGILVFTALGVVSLRKRDL